MNKNLTLFSAKAIACFFVICLHISLTGKVGMIATNFARFAVPLFFMITGYYTFYSDNEKTSKKLNERIKKILKLVGVSFTFYLILNIVLFLVKGSINDYLNIIKSYKNILKFVILNWTTPVIGVGHLWYLFAMLYVYILIKIVNKFNLYKLSYILSILIIFGIYILEIINSTYKLGILQIYYRNAWFMGFAFFMLGHLIRANKDKMVLSNKKIIIFSILLMICIPLTFYLEKGIMNGDNCLFLNNIILDIGIFIIAINKSDINIFSNIGELDSKNIYIIHYAIIVIINNFFIVTQKNILPIVVFIISYVLSLGYRNIKKVLKK